MACSANDLSVDAYSMYILPAEYTKIGEGIFLVSQWGNAGGLKMQLSFVARPW